MASPARKNNSKAIIAVCTSFVIAAAFVLWPYSHPVNETELFDLPTQLVFDGNAVTRPRNTLRYTLSRPLFSPERKPGAISVDAAAEETVPDNIMSTDEFELKGTLEKEGQTLAFIKWEGAPGGIWLGAGSDLNQWVIDEVFLDHILLRSDDAVAIVSLFPNTVDVAEGLDVSE